MPTPAIRHATARNGTISRALRSHQVLNAKLSNVFEFEAVVVDIAAFGIVFRPADFEGKEQEDRSLAGLKRRQGFADSRTYRKKRHIHGIEKFITQARPDSDKSSRFISNLVPGDGIAGSTVPSRIQLTDRPKPGTIEEEIREVMTVVPMVCPGSFFLVNETYGLPKPEWAMRRLIASIVVSITLPLMTAGSAFAQQGQDLPVFGLEGPGWAEVLSVTPKWVVLQTADGRQYPVAGDAMGRFIVRWPILPTMVSSTALVEVEGASPSVNLILTDNVEVYEGAARNFVQPTFLTPTDAGILRQYDATYTFGFDSMNQFWSMYPSQPAVGMQNVPLMTYMVAPVANVVPLMLGTPSNQVFRIAPANGRTYNLTRIVVGTMDQLRQGDLVYAVPQTATPKGMGLAVLIVYKNDLPVPNSR